MKNIIRLFQSRPREAKEQRHARDGMERITSPQLETISYEFMLENQADIPSESFDRWRSRMPQG